MCRGHRVGTTELPKKAYQIRSPYIPGIKVDPELDNLRSDPRFQEFLQKLNLVSGTDHRGTNYGNG